MITDIWSLKPFEELTPEELSIFNTIVLKDIRSESEEDDTFVLLNNINLWMFQLRIIRKDVEFQLASQKSKDKIKFIELNNNVDKTEANDYLIRQNKWRMGAIRFLTAIEQRMLYVKMILSETTHQNILENTI